MADDPGAADTVAGWYFDEWGKNGERFSLDFVREKVSASINHNKPPLIILVVASEHRRRGVESLLLSALMQDLPANVNKVKVNNIDHSGTGMRQFVENAGAEWVIDQYEMKYRLR